MGKDDIINRERNNKEDAKFWFYKNKNTGEVVKSSFIDSRYWDDVWECVDNPSQGKKD